MNRSTFLAALAEHGIVGLDAETALDSWRTNPTGADGVRVHTVLARLAGAR